MVLALVQDIGEELPQGRTGRRVASTAKAQPLPPEKQRRRGSDILPVHQPPGQRHQLTGLRVIQGARLARRKDQPGRVPTRGRWPSLEDRGALLPTSPVRCAA